MSTPWGAALADARSGTATASNSRRSRSSSHAPFVGSPDRALATSAPRDRSMSVSVGESVRATRIPWSSVTSTHAAPSSWRYSSAWSSTLPRSEPRSSRSRNCGTWALTALMPAKVAVRPERNACTPRRTPASARRIAASAVRFAWSEVSPSVTPSTAATDTVAATKILAPSPSRGTLITLVAGIRGIVFAVLVLVGHPAEAARVELELDPRRSRGGDLDLPHDLGGALVPRMQRVRAGRHVIDHEGSIGRRLRGEPIHCHQHERHHARVDVAEHPDQTRARKGPTLRFSAPVLPEVELVRIARREDVVIEGIVVREPHRRAERDDHDPRHEFLVVDGDLDGDGWRGRARSLEIHHGGAQVGRRLVLLLEHRDASADPSLRRAALPSDAAQARQECDPPHRSSPLRLRRCSLPQSSRN